MLMFPSSLIACLAGAVLDNGAAMLENVDVRATADCRSISEM